MSDGKGCTCMARSEVECSCAGVDWRSAREVELEYEVKRLNDFAKLQSDDIQRLHAKIQSNLEDWMKIRKAHDRLKLYAEDMAEMDCAYGDNCLPFEGTRYGQCPRCSARQAIKEASQ